MILLAILPQIQQLFEEDTDVRASFGCHDANIALRHFPHSVLEMFALA
jgi:hypothetical protein